MLRGMNRFATALIELIVSPVAYGKECAAPPVLNSGQAVCLATAYAAKNRLAHGSGVKARAKKGAVRPRSAAANSKRQSASV